MPAVWQRAWGVHTEHDATSWSFSARGRRNRARAYSRMACSSRILEETADGDYWKQFTPKGIRKRVKSCKGKVFYSRSNHRKKKNASQDLFLHHGNMKILFLLTTLDRSALSRLADKPKHRLYALNKEDFWNKMFFSVKSIFHILKISTHFAVILFLLELY